MVYLVHMAKTIKGWTQTDIFTSAVLPEQGTARKETERNEGYTHLSSAGDFHKLLQWCTLLLHVDL